MNEKIQNPRSSFVVASGNNAIPDLAHVDEILLKVSLWHFNLTFISVVP